MALDRVRLVVGFLTAFLWGISPAATQAPARQLHVEAEFPQRGDFMSVGFGSLWMMGNEKLIRVALADNAVTEIPVKGAAGEFRRTVVGEGAVWVADNQTIYKIDPKTNLVVMTIPADFPVNSGAEGIIGVGEGAVWAVTGGSSDQVFRANRRGAGDDSIALPKRACRCYRFWLNLDCRNERGRTISN